eukprot:s352_g21.t1
MANLVFEVLAFWHRCIARFLTQESLPGHAHFSLFISPHLQRKASPSREPVIFNLDDDGAGLPKLTRPTSLEDWEQGLEMLNTAQTRDRQASLRAHWLLSGKNAANSPVQKR